MSPQQPADKQSHPTYPECVELKKTGAYSRGEFARNWRTALPQKLARIFVGSRILNHFITCANCAKLKAGTEQQTTMREMRDAETVRDRHLQNMWMRNRFRIA
jgi:hypothetical protein